MDDSTPLLLDSPLDCTSSRKLEQTYDELLCSSGDNNRWVYVPCLLVVMAIVGVNYSVLVPDLNTGQSIAFHILLGLLIVSWIQSIITHPGPVPEGWSQRVKELHEQHGGGIASRFEFNMARNSWKPCRSHNDRVTGRLVLNMDHFCPWICNTVGFCNRKFFVLFLFYTWMVLCLLVVALQARYGAEADRQGGWSWFWVTYVGDALLGLVILGFWAYHMWLILINSTTVEQAGRNPPAIYNVGAYANLQQASHPPLTLCFALRSRP